MYKRLLRYTRNIFNFTNAEAKGFLAMAGILAGLSAFFLFYDATPSNGYTSFPEDQAVLDSMVALMENRIPDDTTAVPVFSAKGRESKKEPLHFYFNPNHLSADSLMLLGIPAALAHRIENYRQKGGVFRKEKDLLKIYGFPDSLYNSLEGFIVIPSASPPNKQQRYVSAETKGKREKSVAKPPPIFDINKADSLELRQINGIGPVLSSRLIRFRDKLGGFVHLNQLYEVYGLDTSVVQKLVERVFIEADFVPDQIPVNSSSAEQLAAHPYISPSQARLIYAYRNQHGPFKQISDLRKIHTSDPEIVNKIAPYISFD